MLVVVARLDIGWRLSQHDVYVRLLEESERDEFFAQVIQTALDQLLTSDLSVEPATVGPLSAEVRGGASSNVLDARRRSVSGHYSRHGG